MGTARYVAKWYFGDPAGGRDRARCEFEFLSHIWRFGVRDVQRPIALDAARRIALYEYVPGRPAGPDDISSERIEGAARLFAAINSEPVRASGRHLPDASDACFAVAQHLVSVDRRIERLAQIKPESETDREAAALVAELAGCWKTVRGRVLAGFGERGELPDFWRCLSPSDFGFHNAIVRPDGRTCFVDFEYAGWDDPAKMAGDFFSHPGVPVPAEHFERFLSIALEPFTEPERLADRARRLRLVSRIRWCCIILNEFLPEVAERRRFANPDVDEGARKRRQLDRARGLLASIEQ